MYAYYDNLRHHDERDWREERQPGRRHEFEYGDESPGRFDGDDYRRLEHGAEIDQEGYYRRNHWRQDDRREWDEPYPYPHHHQRGYPRHEPETWPQRGNYRPAQEYEAYWENQNHNQRPMRHWGGHDQQRRWGRTGQNQFAEERYERRHRHAPDMRDERIDYGRPMHPDLEWGHFSHSRGGRFDDWY